jgi:hypothetical protein
MKVLSLTLFVTAAAAAQSTPNVTNIRVIHHDGQTFITWNDVAPGAAGANYRYDIYRSLTPITDAASLKVAKLIQLGVFNNSGQFGAQFPYSQATRQDGGKAMAVVEQGTCGTRGAYSVCGKPLEPFTGLAVHTATETASAYYAVITTDQTHIRRDSPVSPGANSTTLPVDEEPGLILPVKYYDSNDGVHRQDVGDRFISGQKNLPLWFSLHGSGGCPSALVFGDLWQLWGDSSMGYQEGIPRDFAVYELHSGATFGQRTLVAQPCDTVWTTDGLGQLETFWFGYLGTQLGAAGSHQWALPVTESSLDVILKWVIAHYGADPNRVYGVGRSMGGWGTSTWALRHPDVFAALFPAMPRWEETAIPNMTTKVTDKATNATLMVDRQTKYQAHMNSVSYVREHCGDTIPFIGWGIGRNDGYASWQEQVDMINVLKSCRQGFAFYWNGGGHGDGPAAARVILTQYETRFARNISYPAFTNSSLDDNPGSGDPAQGDLAGCINCGFTWTDVHDAAELWSANLSNAKNPGTMRVDVTPRNEQAFRHPPGSVVAWHTSTGQAGTVMSDRFGLVTATGIVLSNRGPVTVSFSVSSMGPSRGRIPH